MSSMKRHMLKKGLKCIYCNKYNTNVVLCKKCGLLLQNPKVNAKIDLSVYYINLDKDICRNNYMITNLKKNGIYATRFNAINFNIINEDDILELFPTITADGLKRAKEFIKKVPGSMGCYLSHILLWKKCIEEDAPYMLILEDDVIFNQFIVLDIINAINKLPNKWSIFHIGSNIVSGFHIAQNIIIADGTDKKGVNSGLFGYVINKETIKSLLDIMLLFVDPYLDCVLRKYHKYIPIYFMKYKPIKHIDIQQSSRISFDNI